jgi:alpha-L-rhamnosidase
MYMFGSIEKFFYRDLAGIAYASPGYGQITIKPGIVGDLTFVKASVKTVRGTVAVDWKKGEESLDMVVTIPVNSEATVCVPKLGFADVVITESGETIWENGKFIRGVPGITAGSDGDDYVVFDVGSGSYTFNLMMN